MKLLTLILLSCFTPTLPIPPIPLLNHDPTDLNNLQTNRDTNFLIHDIYIENFIDQLLHIFAPSAPSTQREEWQEIIKQGASLQGVYRGIALQQNAQQIFPSSSQINQLLLYLRPLLGENKLSLTPNLSLFQIIEFFLEIFDQLEGSTPYQKFLGQKNNLTNKSLWYAHFSSRLAKKYSANYRDKIRKNSDLLKHYHWGEEFGVEMMRGEIIIKLAILLYNFSPENNN